MSINSSRLPTQPLRGHSPYSEDELFDCHKAARAERDGARQANDSPATLFWSAVANTLAHEIAALDDLGGDRTP